MKNLPCARSTLKNQTSKLGLISNVKLPNMMLWRVAVTLKSSLILQLEESPLDVLWWNCVLMWFLRQLRTLDSCAQAKLALGMYTCRCRIGCCVRFWCTCIIWISISISILSYPMMLSCLICHVLCLLSFNHFLCCWQIQEQSLPSRHPWIHVPRYVELKHIHRHRHRHEHTHTHTYTT